MKQEYVAELIGVSPATYSKIENNKTRLSAVRLQQIAAVLQVPLTSLLADNTTAGTTADAATLIAFQKQQLLERDKTIFELERERDQNVERERRLLNYIKMLEQQVT